MGVSGPVIKKYQGGISSGASTIFFVMALFGILGAVGILAVYEDIMYAVSYDEEDMMKICLWGLFGIFTLLAAIGLMGKVAYSKGKLKKSYLEIRADGVVIQPLRGDRNSEEFNAKFEEINRLYINKVGYFTQLSVEGKYGQKGILYVPDNRRAAAICDEIRQEAQKCGVAL